MLKAQSEIISIVLVTIVAISLVSTAYFWGIPLIQKQQDTSLVERVFNNFNPDNPNSLPRRMQYIINVGGDEIYTVAADGVWRLDDVNDSLEFSFLAKVSNFPEGGDFYPVGSSASCNETIGIIGKDNSYIVCGSSIRVEGDRFQITYRIKFIELKDTTGENYYKVDIVKPITSPSTSSSKSIRLTREEPVKEGNNITTKLRIILQ
jgi:hypothetical protein